MAEINYSLGGLDETASSFGAMSVHCDGWKSQLQGKSRSHKSSGDTPEMAYAIASFESAVYQSLGELAASTEEFFKSAKTLMVEADESSPFEG